MPAKFGDMGASESISIPIGTQRRGSSVSIGIDTPLEADVSSCTHFLDHLG